MDPGLGEAPALHGCREPHVKFPGTYEIGPTVQIPTGVYTRAPLYDQPGREGGRTLWRACARTLVGVA